MSEPGQDPGRRRRGDRRTLGQTPKPGRIYSSIVGLLFLAVILVGTISTLGSNDQEVLGLDSVDTDLPLAEFAVPVAASSLDGDANIAQDNCEVDQLPCPANDRRTPACEIKVAQSIRICDYFDRPLVISFWFTKGGDNCEVQQDVVSEVSRRYRGRVGFVSIDVRDSRDTIRDLVRSRGWKMPVGYDHDGAVATLYRVGGCPTFVYAYPGGILESASIGELSAAQLSAKADDLLAATRRKERTGA